MCVCACVCVCVSYIVIFTLTVSVLYISVLCCIVLHAEHWVHIPYSVNTQYEYARIGLTKLSVQKYSHWVTYAQTGT